MSEAACTEITASRTIEAMDSSGSPPHVPSLLMTSTYSSNGIGKNGSTSSRRTSSWATTLSRSARACDFSSASPSGRPFPLFSDRDWTIALNTQFPSAAVRCTSNAHALDPCNDELLLESSGSFSFLPISASLVWCLSSASSASTAAVSRETMPFSVTSARQQMCPVPSSISASGSPRGVVTSLAVDDVALIPFTVSTKGLAAAAYVVDLSISRHCLTASGDVATLSFAGTTGMIVWLLVLLILLLFILFILLLSFLSSLIALSSLVLLFLPLLFDLDTTVQGPSPASSGPWPAGQPCAVSLQATTGASVTVLPCFFIWLGLTAGYEASVRNRLEVACQGRENGPRWAVRRFRVLQDYRPKWASNVTILL